jgi:hypothetical protein
MLKSILYDVNFLKVSVSRLKQCLNQKKIKCSLKVYHRLCEKYVIKKNSIIYLEMKYVVMLFKKFNMRSIEVTRFCTTIGVFEIL